MLVVVQQNVGWLEVQVPDIDVMELDKALQDLYSHAHCFWHAHWPCTATHVRFVVLTSTCVNQVHWLCQKLQLGCGESVHVQLQHTLHKEAKHG